MNRNDPEELLRAFEGPEPRPETTRAIIDAAREAIRPTAAAPVAPSKSEPAGGRHRAVSAHGPRRAIRWAIPAAAASIAVAAIAGMLLHSMYDRRTRGRQIEPSPAKSGRGPIAAAKSDGLRRLRGTEWIPLPAGAPLNDGDQLSASARADLAFNDGSSVRVDRDARLTIKWALPAGTQAQTHTDGHGLDGQHGQDAASEDSSTPAATGRPHVELAAGRIFLRVARGNGTFTVSASAAVRVVGTIFGVEERNNRTSVNVLDGRVAVESAGTAIELARGQSGSAALGLPPAIVADDPDKVTAWARDPTKFEEPPLGEVLDWLESNSSFRFTVTPGALRQTRVNLSVMDEPMQQVVEALSLACGLNVAIDGPDVAITAK